MIELLRNPESFRKILELTVSALSVDDIMTKVMDELNELFGCDRCTLYVVDKDANELYTQVAQKSSIGNFRLPIERNSSFASFVAVTGREIIIDDVYDERQVKKVDQDHVFSGEMDKKSAFRTKSMISVPITMGGETIGVLQAMNKPGGFLQKDLDAMREFAPILALALSHALLVKKLAVCAGQQA